MQSVVFFCQPLWCRNMAQICPLYQKGTPYVDLLPYEYIFLVSREKRVERILLKNVGGYYILCMQSYGHDRDIHIQYSQNIRPNRLYNWKAAIVQSIAHSNVDMEKGFQGDISNCTFFSQLYNLLGTPLHSANLYGQYMFQLYYIFLNCTIFFAFYLLY